MLGVPHKPRITRTSNFRVLGGSDVKIIVALRMVSFEVQVKKIECFWFASIPHMFFVRTAGRRNKSVAARLTPQGTLFSPLTPF